MLRRQYSSLRIALFKEEIMAKGFVNLNRFKYGRAIKRNSKQKTDLQSKKKIRGKGIKFRG